VTRFLKYFLRGLVVVAPLAITIYICVAIFQTIDGWLGFKWNGSTVHGVGFAITIVVITLIGFLATSLIARGALAALESVFERLPFVRLLYTSSKDMLSAFVGEKRRFDKPVIVTLSADGAVNALGFLTADSMESLGIADHVTVYVPQSYGFAGNMLVVRREQVRRLDADSAEVMAYIISGGVTEMDRGRPPESGGRR
jgi:uncharacterized membrane protein